ncbi:hypothetical protein JOD20_001406 [Herpetosiphon giganteus]|nr:hypothetical protein [Herpetosiphon giganteus]
MLRLLSFLANECTKIVCSCQLACDIVVFLGSIILNLLSLPRPNWHRNKRQFRGTMTQLSG